MTSASIRPSEVDWEAAHRAGLEDGRFLVQRCDDCGRSRWFPSVRCPHCRSGAHEWVEGPMSGVVYTWTTTYKSFHPDFTDLPLTVVVVELDGPDDMHVVAQLVEADGDEDPRLQVGARVDLYVDTDQTGRSIVRARLPIAALGGQA